MILYNEVFDYNVFWNQVGNALHVVDFYNIRIYNSEKYMRLWLVLSENTELNFVILNSNATNYNTVTVYMLAK